MKLRGRVSWPGLHFFCGNLALNDHLVIPAWIITDLPQGVFALHALIADHGIHDGLLEGVMQLPAMGGADHDAETFLAFIAI